MLEAKALTNTMSTHQKKKFENNLNIGEVVNQQKNAVSKLTMNKTKNCFLDEDKI